MNIWRRSYGSTISLSLIADLNGNGLVDVADYTMIADQLTEPSGATAIPEPTASMLLVISGLTLVSQRR